MRPIGDGVTPGNAGNQIAEVRDHIADAAALDKNLAQGLLAGLGEDARTLDVEAGAGAKARERPEEHELGLGRACCLQGLGKARGGRLDLVDPDDIEIGDALEARGHHVRQAVAQVVGVLSAMDDHGKQRDADAVLGACGRTGQHHADPHDGKEHDDLRLHGG